MIKGTAKLKKVLCWQALSSLTKRSSTKDTGGESGPGDGIGNHVLPVAPRSSTVAQEEILQPARPAQPGLLQSALSKVIA